MRRGLVGEQVGPHPAPEELGQHLGRIAQQSDGNGFAGPAADEGTEPGIFVTVTNPITSTVVNQIKEAITRAEKRQELRKIIFDFNPDGREAATPEFGVCLDLAKFIREKRGEGKLLTVAFVRNKTTRNTVLPVLACDEIIMGPDGVIKTGTVMLRKA